MNNVFKDENIKRVKAILEKGKEAKAIADEFNAEYKRWALGHPDSACHDYYCGITNDTQRRETEHNAKFFYVRKCSSFEEAKRVEELLHNMGFDTGDQLGNGVDTTRYVYIYLKSKETKETKE